MDEEHTSGSAKKRRKSHADGLALTKSGRVSIRQNDVNARYDASYRNSANTTKLLCRSVTFGQACGIIGVALHGSDLPLEDTGNILHSLHILHILHFFSYIVKLAMRTAFLGHNDRLVIFLGCCLVCSYRGRAGRD